MDSSQNDIPNQASRVLNTGIALVHEGEVILPAAGSEAQAEQVMYDARTTIAYYFPVEIEVRAVERGLHAEAIIDEAHRRLAQTMESS
jgi:hypothetical protein